MKAWMLESEMLGMAALSVMVARTVGSSLLMPLPLRPWEPAPSEPPYTLRPRRRRGVSPERSRYTMSPG